MTTEKTTEKAKEELKKYQFLWPDGKDNKTKTGLIIRKLYLREFGNRHAVVEVTFLLPGENKEVTNTLNNFFKKIPRVCGAGLIG